MDSLILTILGIILSLMTLGGFLWFIFYAKPILTQVSSKEKDIFTVRAQIDNMEESILPKIQNSLVTQSQLNRMVEKECKPLKVKLEKLKLERQFLLDRISIFGLVKK